MDTPSLEASVAPTTTLSQVPSVKGNHFPLIILFALLDPIREMLEKLSIDMEGLRRGHEASSLDTERRLLRPYSCLDWKANIVPATGMGYLNMLKEPTLVVTEIPIRALATFAEALPTVQLRGTMS